MIRFWNALHFLLDNIDVCYSSSVYRQFADIHMCTNCLSKVRSTEFSGSRRFMSVIFFLINSILINYSVSFSFWLFQNFTCRGLLKPTMWFWIFSLLKTTWLLIIIAYIYINLNSSGQLYHLQSSHLLVLLSCMWTFCNCLAYFYPSCLF